MTDSKNSKKQAQETHSSQKKDRPIIGPNAAGVDVGAREMYVAIPPDRDAEPVRVFPTFTADLEALADWLIERGITTVAMESTGVYWIPLYQILEDRGLRPCLVNARHMRNVPGRRTDWHEMPVAPVSAYQRTAASGVPAAAGRVQCDRWCDTVTRWSKWPASTSSICRRLSLK